MVASIAVPLLSAVLGAAATSVSKAIVDDLGAARLTVLTFAGVFVVMLPVSPFFFEAQQLSLFLPMLAGVVLLDAIANYLFFLGLERDHLSRVTALAALSPVVTALVTPLVLPAEAGIVVTGAAVAVFLAVALIESDRSPGVVESLVTRRNGYVLLAAAIFGTTALPTRLMLTEYGLTNAPTFYWLRAAGIAVVLAAVLRPRLRGLDRRLLGIIGVKSTVVSAQWVLMLYALAHFNVVTAKALSQTVPVFTLFAGWEWFDDAVTWRKVTAIGLIVGTVAVLQATGSSL